MRRYKNRIIAGIIILIILAVAFMFGGNVPKSDKIHEGSEYKTAVDTQRPEMYNNTEKSEEEQSKADNPMHTASATPTQKQPEIKHQNEAATIENKPVGKDERPLTAEEKIEMSQEMSGNVYFSVESGDADYSAENGMKLDSSTGKDVYLTEPVPEGKSVPTEPQNTEISDKELMCSLSVRCDTVLNNMPWLDKEKAELVPKDGVIFSESNVIFYEGESVFNVLVREMKKNKIHMEFTKTPVYNSAYIEGINNIYEFDCGELSGWMYKVNDWFPNYGCSRYQLHDGDNVEFVYTCDLGADVGGYNARQQFYEKSGD